MLERLQRRQDLYEFREKFRTVLDSKPAMQNTSTYYKNNTEYIQGHRENGNRKLTQIPVSEDAGGLAHLHPVQTQIH